MRIWLLWKSSTTEIIIEDTQLPPHHLSVDKSIRADYDSAFLKLIDEIEQKLVKEGRAYDMATLSGMYRRHLTDAGMEKAVVDTYKVQNLKRRLIQHYGEKIQFYQQHERNKSELVCSSSLNLAEIINLVAELTELTKESLTIPAVGDTWAQVLYHAAVITQPLSFEVK